MCFPNYQVKYELIYDLINLFDYIFLLLNNQSIIKPKLFVSNLFLYIILVLLTFIFKKI